MIHLEIFESLLHDLLVEAVHKLSNNCLITYGEKESDRVKCPHKESNHLLVLLTISHLTDSTHVQIRHEVFWCQAYKAKENECIENYLIREVAFVFPWSVVRDTHRKKAKTSNQLQEDNILEYWETLSLQNQLQHHKSNHQSE
jgi:hypothetical protein